MTAQPTNHLTRQTRLDTHTTPAGEVQTSPTSHCAADTQAGLAGGATSHPPGHEGADTHTPAAGRAHDTAAAIQLSTPIAVPLLRAQPSTGHPDRDTQRTPAGGDPTPDQATEAPTPKLGSPGRAPTPAAAANVRSTPILRAPRLLDHDHLTRHASDDTQTSFAGEAPTPAAAANLPPTPTVAAPRLLDPFLALAADVVTDLENVRISNENRLRQLTRTATDSDGQERGFGLTEHHPDVARLTAIVQLIERAEHDATLQLQRVMRRHPLGPWIKATIGIGEKQGARLLAAVGDPHWNTLHDRPRTVSELWAYCGLHTLPADHPHTDPQQGSVGRAQLPASQSGLDTQITSAGGTDHPTDQDRTDTHARCVGGGTTGSSGPDQTGPDTQRCSVWTAARRKRGQRANWSNTAKMRAYLCAESCIKQARSPYRAVYDQRRTATADRVHAVPCVRCGPAGKPAPEGSPWSLGHQHADALRITAKTILRDLWRAARDHTQT